MKKYLVIATAVGLVFGSLQLASAADIAQTEAGGQVTITVTGTNPPFNPFSPSTGVVMDGVTGVSDFAVAAYHNQVLAKKSGMEFGMAADSAAMWTRDISATGATATTVATDNSLAFAGDGWEKM